MKIYYEAKVYDCAEEITSKYPEAGPQVLHVHFSCEAVYRPLTVEEKEKWAYEQQQPLSAAPEYLTLQVMGVIPDTGTLQKRIVTDVQIRAGSVLILDDFPASVEVLPSASV